MRIKEKYATTIKYHFSIPSSHGLQTRGSPHASYEDKRSKSLTTSEQHKLFLSAYRLYDLNILQMREPVKRLRNFIKFSKEKFPHYKQTL